MLNMPDNTCWAKYKKQTKQDKILSELMNRLGMSDKDYLLVCSRITPDLLKTYLDYAYAVGYEDGSKVNVLHGMKPIRGYKDSEEIQFKSIREAARRLHITHSNIVRAIKSGKRCGGYRWYYMNKED